MAPLRKAIHVEETPGDFGHWKAYEGFIDGDWTVGAVPNGGFVLAQIIEAAIKFQEKTPHVDPIHVTAHFLSSATVAPFRVLVKPAKIGKGFTNLVAELIQGEQVRVTSHLIFGLITLPSATASTPRLTLEPPSPYARRVPLHHHPSNAPSSVDAVRDLFNFGEHYKSTDEAEIAKGNDKRAKEHSGIGGGGVEWATWFELTDTEERIRPPYLALLSDVFLNSHSVLPDEIAPGKGLSWYPTMVMTLEFKAPIPPPSKDHSGRTIGMFSSGTFINDPRGRHDSHVELWTAPCNIGEGQEEEGWREKQRCIAVATQMALIVSVEVNTRRKTTTDNVKANL